MGAAAFFMFLAGIVVVLELNKGNLTIESEFDDVPIRIMQGDEVVEKLAVSRKGAAIRIAAGQYIIEVEGNLDGIIVANRVVSSPIG